MTTPPQRLRRALLAAPMLAWAGAQAEATAGASAGAGAAAPDDPATQAKVLRFGFQIAETSFDPAQISDTYSRTVCNAFFDAPLEFEFLARPVRMRVATAAAMPEVADDFKTFTFTLQPGIHFADDPAFKGRRRELVAEDYVYSIKRHYDPRWKSPNLYLLENAGILGLSELRQRLLKARQPFDYDTPVEGLRALDRYRFQIRLGRSSPRFLYNFADGSFTGALAREVVEAYGDRIGEHPVGTGAFVLQSWRRSSRMVLARNPNYRPVFYDEHPPEGDLRRQAIAAQLKGRRLPMVDRVVITVIEEPQPRWLSFLSREQDMVEIVPNDFANIAFPNNVLAPNLAKQGIQMVRYARSDVAVSYFSMDDPVVGGNTSHKVALRRAISLGVDLPTEIRLVRRNQAVPAQGPIAPEVFGYDPGFKTEMSDFDRGRAQALLDLYGYVDRNGDGWREQPDGTPLVIEYASSPDQLSRQLIEQWQKNMQAIGLRMVFKLAKWPEQLKAARAGKLMMWGMGWIATQPDGDTFLGLGYGPNKGQSNLARFDLPAFNALYEQQTVMPDGPERLAVMQKAAELMVAYMPYKVHVHRIFTDLAHPWLIGYDRNIYVRDFFRYVDLDPALARRHGVFA